jgi:FkbM family methyltransferase
MGVISRLFNSTLPVYRRIIPPELGLALGTRFWDSTSAIMKNFKAVKVSGGKYQIFVNPQDVWGFQFFIDHYRYGRWLYYEPYERGLFVNMVRSNPNSVVVDIGASYGFYALDVSAEVAPDQVKKMVAIEPDRETFACLARSFKVNGFHERVLLVNAAAIDRHNMECPFYRHESVAGWNKLVAEGPAYRSDYAIRGVTLDRLLSESSIEKTSKFIIKIDIEGGEPRALAGMRETIKSAAGYQIFSEFHPPALKLSSHDPMAYAAQIVALQADLVLEIDELGFRVEPIVGMADFERIISRCLAAEEWWKQFTNILISKNMSLVGLANSSMSGH